MVRFQGGDTVSGEGGRWLYPPVEVELSSPVVLYYRWAPLKDVELILSSLKKFYQASKLGRIRAL